jgi:hypothetical protein
LLPLVLSASLLLVGCGHEQHDALTVSSTSSTADPTPSPARARADPLADFPLDLGYPEENGDDGSPVQITTTPATRRFRLCDLTAWDPRHGTTDLRGVRFRGESEYARGRTLTLYPGTGAAGVAVTRAREAVEACADEPDGQGQGTTHTMVERSLGDQSVVWTDTFYSVNGGERQHDTGLVVYEVVRVGRAVLLAYDYDEGNGTPASRRQSIARSVRQEGPLVARMREVFRAR